jgi:tetratricopeptide (TPR) repeat protein
MNSKKNAVIAVLAALVVILLGTNLFVIFRYGGGTEAVAGFFDGLSEMEGIRELVTRVNVGGDPREAAIELLQEGSALEQEGEHREALEAYQEARELIPDEFLVYVGLASAHEGLGDVDQALAYLEQADRLEPDSAYVHRHLGRLRCIKGEYDECVRTLERAVELDPDDKMGHYWLGSAYQSSSEDGFEKSLGHYLEALRRDPEFGEAHLGLAFLYKSQPGKEALSIEEFKQALESEWEFYDEEYRSIARAELANLYYGQNDYDRCIQEWKQVLEDDSEDARAHFRLGLCYGMRGREGDLEKAVAEMEEGLALGFSNVDIYYQFLGKLREEQDDRAGAIWAWEQFLRFSDDEDLNAEVRERIDQLAD